MSYFRTFEVGDRVTIANPEIMLKNHNIAMDEIKSESGLIKLTTYQIPAGFIKDMFGFIGKMATITGIEEFNNGRGEKFGYDIQRVYLDFGNYTCADTGYMFTSSMLAELTRQKFVDNPEDLKKIITRIDTNERWQASSSLESV